jgi:hypothetical protein
MSQTLNLIFDVETMGIESNSILLDVSVLVYDIVGDREKPIADLMKSSAKRFKLDVTEQKRKGRVIDPETLAWWQTQGPEVLKNIHPLPTDLKADQFYAELCQFLNSFNYDKKVGLIWQRGTPDIHWVDSYFAMFGYQDSVRPMNWRKVRDVRTAVDISGVSSRLNGYPDGFWEEIKDHIPNFNSHDSIHDVAKEVFCLRKAGIF